MQKLDGEIRQYNEINIQNYIDEIDGERVPKTYTHENVLDRIDKNRNEIMHGELSYSGIPLFYAILFSIIFLHEPDIYTPTV